MTAAFIGPGTVTTCTLAGVRFGYALLWTLAFATVGTIVLQEMSARLGVVRGIGLGEALRRRFHAQTHPVMRLVSVALVVGAIGVGNAAYQTGNLLGAALGMQALVGGDVRAWALGVAAVASLLLWTGRYRMIERVLVAMVILMAAVFLVTAASLVHDGSVVLRGAVIPTLPGGSWLVALGLVGTTIVPYNLFLHASTARERWRGEAQLPEARADLVIAIGAGGIVSMAIVAAAAAAPLADATDAATMARALEPLLGTWARAFFAIGLAAAGLTSAVTAPMAAAYAISGILGWAQDLRYSLLRVVWILVMLSGVAFAATGVRPVPAILFAQAANGLLLPAVALFLLFVMNDRRLVRRAVNGRVANVLGGLVVLVTALLGVRALLGVLGLLG